MGRSPCSTREELNKGAWTAEEDRILRAYIKAHGEGRWRRLPKIAGLKRCGKSCRLRWLNYLRPDIKRGNITHEEDDLIIRLHKLLGNRWSLIAGRLPGRTDNEIKNYWNSHLRKKMKDQQQVEAAMPSTGEVTCLVRTKPTRCMKKFAAPEEQIAENADRNEAVEQVVRGDAATEKTTESKSVEDSCLAPQEDNWWDCLVGLDASNAYPSKALAFDLIHDTGEDCKGVIVDWMSEWMLSDNDLDPEALASFPKC